jgi:hypothetical protein
VGPRSSSRALDEPSTRLWGQGGVLFLGSFFVVGMWKWFGHIWAGEASVPSRDSVFLAALFGAFLAFGVYGASKAALRLNRARKNPIASE